MNTYETSATVGEHGQIRVVGAPFEPGTEVEVTIRAKASANLNARAESLEEARAILPEIDHARQQEIADLRAQYQEQFDRIEGKTPNLDELLSMTVEPPHEWLNER
jgi:hypothetical protein